MRAPLALLCCLLVLPSWAEETTVYKRVRPDGTVEFSDEPTPDGEAVEVAPLLTYPSPPLPRSDARPRTESAPAPAPAAEVRYERLQITEPAADGTVFFDAQGTTVAVSLKPALQPGHVIAIYLNGKRAASAAADRFTLKDIYRGTHTVTATVEDDGGGTLLRSAPLTFHLIQHTKR